MTTTVNEILAVMDSPIHNRLTKTLDDHYDKKWKRFGEHYQMTHLVLSRNDFSTTGKKVVRYSIRSIGYTVGYIDVVNDIIREIYVYDVPSQVNKYNKSNFKIKELLDNKFLGKNFSEL